MHKYVLFDLDNTLYNYDHCHETALRNTFKNYINTIPIHTLKLKYKGIKTNTKNNLLKTGSSHSRLIYFKQLVEECNLDISPLKLNTCYWTKFYENIKPFKGTIEFLKLLKKHSIKIGIITNFTLEHQLKKIKYLGLDKYIDHIVTSEETLLEKPHPLPFYTMLNKFNCLPKDAVMIGDSYENDILPAKKIGIDTIHLNKEVKDFGFTTMESLLDFYSIMIERIEKMSEISRRIGERFDLVQAGGGNVSFKFRDLMFIKSSGTNISEINLFNGYTIIDLNQLRNNQSNSLIDCCVIKKNKPSIETYMHSFLKTYTVHIHPIETNFYLVQKDTGNLFDNELVIDYITPGKSLADEIEKKYKDENVIFLKNHGIIVTSGNIDEIIPLINKIMNKYNHSSHIVKTCEVSNKISSLMESIYNKPFITSKIKGYVEGRSSSISLFPDKVVYCGHYYFKEEITKENIRNFVERTKEIPKIFIHESSIYICSNSLKKCKEIEEVFISHELILNQQSELQELDLEEIHYLLNWEDEKFRMNVT